MSGDYSRQRFDPVNDFSGVLMQQGRVQLDADWNELVDIVDRRLRAETTDIIGRATVPSETPDGFKIAITGGVPTIGPGRMYVDGLLAENHGFPPEQFDPILAELGGTDPVPYDQQPYFPGVATAAPFPATGGPHLVYLDVWQREVTYLEDLHLLENALGVDTTTRYQTVWQVRVLADVGTGITCETPDSGLANWPATIAPSAGRLTTAAVGVPAEDDPCLTPASGGFRGLENRLYRVEVHDPGTHTSATFKWSRDNASVASAVTGIPDLSNIVVVRTGRDAELRFHAGDWLEITDDWLEFAGKPGMMARVQDVNDASRTITLASPLPAGLFPTDAQGATDSKRHTRIRRWDQSGQVTDTDGNLLVDLDQAGSTGLIPLPPDGTSIVLEDGVQITFQTSPAGGTYHTADYWVFAARTADASVEPLTEAPPRGIHHHYCRLAIITLPNDISNCRTLWPPAFGDTGCDCTVCVSPEGGGAAIQAAIEQVKAVGGTICLGVGTYNLGNQPLQITAAQSLKIRGQGWKTQLIYLGAGPAVTITNAMSIQLEEVAILTSGAQPASGMAIGVRNAGALTIQRCGFMQLGGSETSQPAIGLTGIIAGGILRENAIMAATGIGAISTAATAPVGTVAPNPSVLLTAGLAVQDNFLLCRLQGIDFEGTIIHAGPTRIASNYIARCEQGGIVALGLTLPGSGLDIVANRLQTSGDAITVGSDGAEVAGNHIVGSARGSGSGIVLRSSRETGIDHCQVMNNEIVNVGGAGIVARSRLGSALIKSNVLEGAEGGGIIMDSDSSAAVLTIENNQLLRISPNANDQSQPLAAIRTQNTAHAAIAGNVVAGLGAGAVQNPVRTGILAVGPSQSVRISDNDVFDIGPVGDFVKESMGIHYVGPFQQLDVTDNRVRRSDTPPSDSSAAAWLALRIDGLPLHQSIAGQQFSFVATDLAVFAVVGTNILRLPVGLGLLSVRGNHLESYGQAQTVRIATRGSCLFDANQCVLDLKTGLPVAAIEAGSLVVNGNYLQGPGDVALNAIVPASAAFTVLGNITQGQIHVNGAPLPAPWMQLNVPA